MTNVCRYFAALRCTVFGAVVAGAFHAAAQPVPPQDTTVVNTGNIVNIVGGVMVNPEGVLNQQDTKGRAEVLEARRKAMQAVPGDLNQPAELRMISLRKLDEKIQECAKSGKPLPDEVKFLAGLQRVKYVFVYPEQNDVVLAGPADGWKLDASGSVVGTTTGQPVMQLDDLLVALRHADAARRGGFSVSIDPTAEGLQRLQAFLATQQKMGPNPQATFKTMEEALGPQKITINGLPGASRFANVMVAADFRMKSLGMKFEPSPVKGLPSYLDLVNPNSRAVQTPRWWLAPKYDPLLTDGQGLAWELRGPGVQCMAEEDFMNAAGQREQTTQASPQAQKWADLMTEHYAELAAKDSVFGDLRNCMDLAIVGALVVRENLLEKANLHPQYLLNERRLVTAQYNPPKQVDSKVGFIKKSRNYVFSVSGGVQLQPWEIVEKQQPSETVAPVRTASAPRSDRWWWNG